MEWLLSASLKPGRGQQPRTPSLGPKLSQSSAQLQDKGSSRLTFLSASYLSPLGFIGAGCQQGRVTHGQILAETQEHIESSASHPCFLVVPQPRHPEPSPHILYDAQNRNSAPPSLPFCWNGVLAGDWNSPRILHVISQPLTSLQAWDTWLRPHGCVLGRRGKGPRLASLSGINFRGRLFPLAALSPHTLLIARGQELQCYYWGILLKGGSYHWSHLAWGWKTHKLVVILLEANIVTSLIKTKLLEVF